MDDKLAKKIEELEVALLRPEVRGKGRVWSWTVVFHSIDPALNNNTAFNIVEVELEEQEGLRLTSNLIDCGPEDIYVGMPVEVVFEKVSDKMALPMFKRASGQ